MNRERLLQTIKEFGRILFLAIPSFLVALGIQYLSSSPELSTGIFGVILTLLKSYDRGVHEDSTTNAKGIAPF